MVRFVVSFNNRAGRQARQEFCLLGDGTDGLPFGAFMQAVLALLESSAVFEGESFSVSIEDPTKERSHAKTTPR
jgi:hypothetical protein